MKYIFTCQANVTKLALSEYKKEDASFHFIDWLEPGVGYMESDLDLQSMNRLIETTPIIFTRHIFEVDLEYDRTDDVAELVSLCTGYAFSVLNQESTYSIQARSLDIETLKSFRNEWRYAFLKSLNQQGYTENTKNPDQIISAFITHKKVYLGCSLKGMNLSNWNGGMMHCAKDDMISRAEFKLLEAFEVFHLDNLTFTHAVDLGAAPGGWSNALLRLGMSVTAIDPAQMNPELMKNPNIKHFREMTQTYLKRGEKQHFDLIVNDMKMDVLESASITNEFESVLSEYGYVIMTFKLPNNFNYLNIKRGIEELSKAYEFVTARQLFHNRSEITVVFRKRNVEV